jgi:hypothetical protein
MLKKIFGPKRERVTGGWRKPRNEELHNLHSSANIVRKNKLRMKWAEYVACMGEMRGLFWCRILR